MSDYLQRLKRLAAPPAPSDQYQVGDDVTYIPAGVRCKIEGYVWRETMAGPPAVAMYRLSCGIEAKPEWIEGERDGAVKAAMRASTDGKNTGRDVDRWRMKVETTPCAESPSPIIKRIEVGPQKTLDGAEPAMY